MQNTETDSTNKSPKLLYHLATHRPLMNNKKYLFLNENDTKNNETFHISLDNLFNKEESNTVLDTKLLENKKIPVLILIKKFF